MQSVENPSQKAAAFPLVAALQLNLVETTATEPYSGHSGVRNIPH
jgi:hypothetical protein